MNKFAIKIQESPGSMTDSHVATEAEAAIKFGRLIERHGLDATPWNVSDQFIAIGFTKGGDPLLNAKVSVTRIER
jgi:hypothetical protein